MNSTTKPEKSNQPPSRNVTHRAREPIEIQSTYRIGICSLRTSCGCQKLPTALQEAALQAFGSFSGPKLLLMAGQASWPPPPKRSKWVWPAEVDEIAQIAREAHTSVLFQITTSPEQGRYYTAVSADGEQLPLEIYQLFATSKDAGRCPELVRDLVEQCDKHGDRAIDVSGITLGLLICGENNVLANEQRNRNRAYVRHDAAKNLFGHLRLIFNGAHTVMGNWGKLERRFEFLSSRKRWALYATNNDKGNWGKVTLRAYFNGSRVATSDERERSSNPALVPSCLVTSKDDRCRILTLDISGRLLQ